MNIVIDISHSIQLSDEEKAALPCIRQVIETAASWENQHREVVIGIVDESVIQEFNQQYRHVDRVTDVLSFPQGDAEEGIPLQEIPLGDILICLPQARKQAALYEHSIVRELCFLAVHGFLHLVGYDHHTSEQAKVMFTRQEEILSSNGLKRNG